MIKTKLAPFWVIGISVRTTGKKEQFIKDIPELWNTFTGKETIYKIPNKLENSIYVIYTDYESDHTEGYTTIIGCKVKNINTVPEGMVGIQIKKNVYSRYTAKGDITKGIVYDKWVNIWETNLNRLYTTDFEIYGDDAKNPKDAEVDIYVSIS